MKLDSIYCIKSTRDDELSIECIQKLSLLILAILGILYGGYMLYKGFTTDYYCGYTDNQKYSQVNMVAYSRHCLEIKDPIYYQVK